MSDINDDPLRHVLRIAQPYLLFLGDARDTTFMKTALGLRDWVPEQCIGEYKCPGTEVSIGLPLLDPVHAHAKGARSLVIGIANIGGVIAEAWIPCLLAALEAGLDIVSGAHAPLDADPRLREAAGRLGRQLVNVRRPPAELPVATGARRSGKRLLTVGTDCALGKKYTALSLVREFRGKGVDADFRATGQTGILIAGAGIPIDAVVSDFVAGAGESLSPAAAADHWDVIEGQGSVFHPSYAGVTVGLLHGSQPDVVVMCHQHGRERIVGLEAYPVPPLEDAIDLVLRIGRLTNPAIRCAGIALNTSALRDQDEVASLLDAYAARHGLPTADPMQRGPHLDRLVEACLA